MGGLVDKNDVLSIIDKKLKLCVVGALQRMLSHKIELEAKNPEKLTQVEKDTK